jgi:hypothetical protein
MKLNIWVIHIKNERRDSYPWRGPGGNQAMLSETLPEILVMALQTRFWKSWWICRNVECGFAGLSTSFTPVAKPEVKP